MGIIFFAVTTGAYNNLWWHEGLAWTDFMQMDGAAVR